MLERIGERLKNSNKKRRFLSYPMLGYLPAEIQERIINTAKVKKYSFVASQIGLSFAWVAGRYILGEVGEYYELPFVQEAFRGYVGASVLSNFVRVGWMAYSSRPIGGLIPEASYRSWGLTKGIRSKLGKILKRYDNLEETVGDNNKVE